MLQVALDDPGTTADTWRGVAEEVLASNAEQESLIEALLALASSQGGLGERELVDLAAVTGEVLVSARPEAGRRGLSVDAVTSPAPLLGDKLLAKRLVANLVGNAVRHNVADGKIEVSTAARDGRAVLAVANTGPAIPPEAGRGAVPALLAARRTPGAPWQRPRPWPVDRPRHRRRPRRRDHRARQAGGGLCIEVTFPARPDEPPRTAPAARHRAGNGAGFGSPR